MMAALIVLAFFAGAWLALVVRGLVADAAHRRMQEAARGALTEGELEHLREYLDVIDEAERRRVVA